MSDVMLEYLAPIGSRKLFAVHLGNEDLGSSFGTGKEFKEPNPLDISRYEQRRKILVEQQGPNSPKTSVPRIQERTDGRVHF